MLGDLLGLLVRCVLGFPAFPSATGNQVVSNVQVDVTVPRHVFPLPPLWASKGYCAGSQAN